MSELRRRVSRVLSATLPVVWSRAIRFRSATGHWPSMSNPRGFNEKVNWRIVRDRRPELVWTSDKALMKKVVAQRAPDLPIPVTLWEGADPADAVGVTAPAWVFKPNASSGAVFFGSGAPDPRELREVAERWDRKRLVSELKEWAYSRASPTLFIEERVGRRGVPSDVKLFVFDGVVRFITVHTDRFGDHRASIYRPDWTRVAGRLPHFEPHDGPVPRPPTLERIIRWAEIIAGDLDFLRVDLLVEGEEVWFGETTAYPWSGLKPMLPASFELEAGSFWTLPDLSAASSGSPTVG